MKKKTLFATLMVTFVLSGAILVGCESEGLSYAANDDIPDGAASLMPTTHEGRYDSLGSSGCYGCHGVNEEGETLLVGITGMPDVHYLDGDITTMEINPSYNQCITCHVIG